METNKFNSDYRIEHDFLGEKEIPASAYYGVQTVRDLENCNISNVPLSFFKELIKAHAMVNQAAAMENGE